MTNGVGLYRARARARINIKRKKNAAIDPRIKYCIIFQHLWNKILTSSRFSKIRLALRKHIPSAQGYRVSPSRLVKILPR